MRHILLSVLFFCVSSLIATSGFSKQKTKKLQIEYEVYGKWGKKKIPLSIRITCSSGLKKSYSINKYICEGTPIGNIILTFPKSHKKRYLLVKIKAQKIGLVMSGTITLQQGKTILLVVPRHKNDFESTCIPVQSFANAHPKLKSISGIEVNLKGKEWPRKKK